MIGEYMNIQVTLSEDQVKALGKLDLKEDAQKIAQNAVNTAIRGKFKYYAEKAEEQTGKHFDFVARAGVKLDTDKGAFVTRYMKEIRDIVAAL
jgi:hypothetical protein